MPLHVLADAILPLPGRTCPGLSSVTVGTYHSLRSALVRPLPYRDAAALVACFRKIPFSPAKDGAPSLTFADWQREDRAFQQMAGFHWQKFYLTDYEPPEQVLGSRVSRQFFSVLGVRAALGRTFSEEAEVSTPTRRVILSEGFRRRRFGTDPGIIGRTLSLDGDEYLITGVMPPEFWFVSKQVQFWVLLPSRPNFLVSIVARLRPGVTPAQAQAEANKIEDRLASGRWAGMRFRSLQDYIYWNARAGVYLFLAALVLVMLVGFVYVYPLLKEDEPLLYRMAAAARVWAFLLLKNVMGLLPLAALWISLAGTARTGEGGDWSFGGLVMLGWPLLLLGCGVMWWSLLDQNSRCPVCLHRLRVPALVGSWSSLVVDRPGIEYICPFGHGRLYVPGTRLLSSPPMHWTFYRDILQRLFSETASPQRGY